MPAASATGTGDRKGGGLASKPWIFMTGGTGGIGQHLVANLRKKYNILRASRSASRSEDEGVIQMDLTDAKSLEKIPDLKFEWVVHLATTYNVKKDMAMVSNLLELTTRRGIPNFCFFSSWVVSFPRRLVREPYLKMKGECEKQIREFCGQHDKHFLIVRPSVVIGENLSWTRTLNRLWYVRHLIPRNMFRCWISIDQVTSAVDHHFKAVEMGRAESRVMQLLGERESLYQATQSRTLTSDHWDPLPDPVSQAFLWLAAPLTFGFRMLAYVVLWMVSLFSTYLNSFYIQHFKPKSEEELLSFFNCYNNCMISGAENMLLWHYTPPWIIEQKKILVTSRGLRTIHSITKDSVVCDAGVTIAELLKALAKKKLTVSTYPNYHDISLGACVAGPVHGHSHQFATVASLIQNIRVFCIDTQSIRIIHKGTPEFMDLVFNTKSRNVLVLGVTLQPCPLEEFVKTRKRFDFLSTSPEVLIKHAKFGDSCEVRMYVPMLDALLGPAQSLIKGMPMLRGLMLTATVWSKKINKPNRIDDEKEQESNGVEQAGTVETIKGDINWKQYVERSTKFLWSLGSKFILNTEWFFTEEEMVVFWKYYQKNWWRFGWYKILIRHCKADDFPHSPCYQRNVYAIDIIALRYQRKFLADLMPKFSKTMHAGKFLCTDPSVDKRDV
mmetsp:Transcript_31163/g.54785  ORF Transcript_31163/g.54785 Transcript_31163/m.54785 type:complete len:668 (+) Transcript_31163:22-2025(+)